MENQVITKMVLITPNDAKELLKLNVANRPVNKTTVNWYARQMISGQWTISGQTISISNINTLIDGQHRLLAVVEADKPIWFNIAYNVPYDSFVNYDAVRSRGLADVFAIEDVLNYGALAAIITKYNAIVAGYTSLTSVDKRDKKKLTNTDYLNLYKSNSSLFQEVYQNADRCYSKIKLFSRSEIGAYMYFLINDKGHSKSKVFSFFKQLFYNEEVENNSIYNLREKIISGNMGQYRMNERIKYIYLIKCWNAFVIGKEIKIYSFSEKEVSPSFI